jgi:hypothetical protein
MMLGKDAARKAWFTGFDAWQDSFKRLLDDCKDNPGKVKAAGKAFLREVMAPFMDGAKDRLLVEIAKDVKASCEKAKGLDHLVNEKNQ